MEDVVYLKNGSIIRGLIIEQIPNESLKIQTKDRNVFAFTFDEILKITKEIPPVENARPSKLDRGYIGISIGASHPIRDFGSKDPYNNSAAFAKAGPVLNISLAYKLHKYFGVAALLHAQTNTVDEPGKASHFGYSSPGTTETFQSNPWIIGGLLAGGYGSYPISNKLSFESRIMCGFLSMKLPDFTDKFTNPNTGDVYIIKERSNSTISFAYSLGAGLKYNVGKRMCILTNVDYMGANATFTDVTRVTNDGSSQRTFTQSFGEFNFTLGAGYRL